MRRLRGLGNITLAVVHKLKQIVELAALNTCSECCYFGLGERYLGAVWLGCVTNENKLPVACNHYARSPVAHPGDPPCAALRCCRSLHFISSLLYSQHPRWPDAGQTR